MRHICETQSLCTHIDLLASALYEPPESDGQHSLKTPTVAYHLTEGGSPGLVRSCEYEPGRHTRADRLWLRALRLFPSAPLPVMSMVFRCHRSIELSL